MPQRKSFWLYDYDQVKYRTPIQWCTLLAVSFIFAVFGSVVVWVVVDEYKSKHGLDIGLLAIGVAFLGAAVIELPASLLFFYRRWRGEITGYFDYEVLPSHETGSGGVNRGTDYR